MPELSIEDQLAIQALYARSNHAIDFGHSEEWAGTFTADGTIETEIGTAMGTAELAAFAANLFSQMKFRHWTNSLVVEGDGAGASGFAYLIGWTLEDGKAPVAGHHAHYEDDLVKTAQGWRFARRRVIEDHVLPGALVSDAAGAVDSQ